MIYRLYTAMAFTAMVGGYGPAAVTRRLVRGVPLHLRERLGWDQDRGPARRSGWLHAVSVGEAITAGPLVDGLRRLCPELGLVMTTTTDTGARVVRERYAGAARHRFFPLDLPGAVRRVTAGIQPDFFISMETEIWPNLLHHLARANVPVMIANGRLSDRSFPRYRMARTLLAPVLDCVTVFAMQSEEDARRMIALGASPERVFVTGNLKAEPPPDAGGSAELWYRLLGLDADARVWIAGSTHRGEEEAALDAHRIVAAEHPKLVLVVAPRHPERVPEVMSLIAARGLSAVRRSELPRERRPADIIVLDTVGELADLYSIADVVFVGGSLTALGGHNMLEPAFRKKPVLFGPHTENFREAAEALVASGGGIRVTDAAELGRELGRLLGDRAVRSALGEAAWQAVVSRHGSARETLDLVARFLLHRSAR